jgi:hypothetical protein
VVLNRWFREEEQRSLDGAKVSKIADIEEVEAKVRSERRENNLVDVRRC